MTQTCPLDFAEAICVSETPFEDALDVFFVLDPELMPELELDDGDDEAGVLAGALLEEGVLLAGAALVSLLAFELFRLFFVPVVAVSVEAACEELMLSLFFMLESLAAEVSLELDAEVSDFLCFFDFLLEVSADALVSVAGAAELSLAAELSDFFLCDFLPEVDELLCALDVSLEELAVADWSVASFFDFFFFLVCVLVSGVVV